MSLRATIAKGSSRHSEGIAITLLGHGQDHYELPDSIFPVSAAKVRGISIAQVENPDHRNDEEKDLEFRTNGILEEFGVPDGQPRSSFLYRFNGNHHYGSTVVKSAAMLGREAGLRGDFQRTIPEVLERLKTLAGLIHQNDVHAARFILTRLGLEGIGEAARTVKGYTAILIGDEMALVPRRCVAENIAMESESLNSVYATLMIQLSGYQRQTYLGLPIYRSRNIGMRINQ